MLPTVEWPTVFVCAVLLCYIPHLALRVPAVHSKLASEKKQAGATAKGLLGGYEIRSPRLAQAAAVDDSPEGRYIARLTGHHDNSHEIFPILVAAVLGALQRGVGKEVVNFWATLWLLSRVVYTLLYITGSSKAFGNARALVWAVGLGLLCYLLAWA